MRTTRNDLGPTGRKRLTREPEECDTCRIAVAGTLRCAQCLDHLFIDAAYEAIDWRDRLAFVLIVLPDLVRLLNWRWKKCRTCKCNSRIGSEFCCDSWCGCPGPGCYSEWDDYGGR